ncbi:hypothetical protein XENTR_v10001334 [Xenopus tropicalis]|uniref:KN motif and ankyrin repeat domain-containing protein 3 n=1 Tax=Xenopus tropicalis TaxID=8364 RepID=F6YHM7_XENTR|nr:KN motif and ankyrin repeat domain-containing protein 3 [Xenopus tropicalis]KAE8631860.1 hypothetical protein XENTR_v10001334 [Xenopus tropicalis]KAE8631861.1 hypothetical protein XENTR_v10001334 [Xenopus tropicalis]|eukprot:XP_002938597.1 PREDICTED: KN motif and ankyrin repeat domain-containing protein 3 [Xenopus tropicalis]
MTQSIHLNQNLPDLGGPFLYRDQDENEKTAYSVETPYGFQLDLDFLKYVDDIQSGQTLKKVPVYRKPRVPRQSTSSLRSPSCQTGGWTSTESLTFSDDGRSSNVFFPRVRTQSNSSDNKEMLSFPKSNPVSPTPVISLLPPPSPKSLLRNHRVEKTLEETSKRLEQEQLNLQGAEGQIRTCSSTSLSKLGVSSTSSPNLSQLPQNLPLNKVGESHGILSPSFSGSVKISPVNSGRSTPAMISSSHLHYVREQMAAALKQLKDLEEQVKAIPILEMKISTLESEKKQLLADLEKKQEIVPLERSFSAVNCNLNESCSEQNIELPSETENELETSKLRTNKIAELKRLTEKLAVPERNVKMSRTGASKITSPPKVMERRSKSIAVGEEMDMNDVVFYYRSQNTNREVAVGCERETKDAEVWVIESLLGMTCEAEKEIELLQHTVDHQRGVIGLLEGHLKEAANELEELRVAVYSRRQKDMADKEVMAHPQTLETASEAVVSMLNQASGEHLKMVDAGVNCCSELSCIAVSCVSEAKEVAVGTDQMLGYQEKSTQANLEKNTEVQSSMSSTIIEAISMPRSDLILKSKCKMTLLAQDEVDVAKNNQDITKHVEKCDKTEESITVAGKVTALNLTTEGGDEHCLIIQNSGEQPEDNDTQKGSVAEEDTSMANFGNRGALKSIMKNKDGASKSQINREKKSLQFVGILNGEYESTSSEESSDNEGDSSSDKVSEDSSDSEALNYEDTSEEEMNVNMQDTDSDIEDCAVEEKRKEEKVKKRKDREEQPTQHDTKKSCVLSQKMQEACLVVSIHLCEPNAVKTKQSLASSHIVQQEWFRASSQKSSVAETVAAYLKAFMDISPEMLSHVVNLTDGNGNTALHYSVSHSNFFIVQLLLDTGVCNVDRQNKAGYTAIMLAALAAVEKEDDMNVVSRLFSLGNVNAKASQAGQTALMLAVSHGRQEMVQALLACGANVNLQDDEGSTALMCASEHGRAEIVKLLLAQTDCDVSITDNDGSNALSIALEAGQNDIAMLLYAHVNFSKVQSPSSDVLAMGKASSSHGKPE